MQTLDVIKLAASSLAKTGAALWQALRPITNDVDDVEPFGEVDVFQGLGLSSMPWPADAEGHAEGVIVTNCGNKNAVCVGARDTRTAKITGNLKPGDTVLHSTGPSQSAQVQCKEEKRQVVIATKDTKGKDHAIVLDAANRKLSIAAFGAIIEVDDGDISLVAKGGKAGILIQDGAVYVLGQVVLGGRVPFAPVIAGTSPPGAPVPGVFVGK